MEALMRVSVLSDAKPPEALLQAAGAYRCPGCAGFIELSRSGSSWTAELAHDRACPACERSFRDEETVVIPLSRAQLRRHRKELAAGLDVLNR
jgi:hypothetical protein